MSLFGKILAVLNIIGAIALFTLAGLAYSKRSSWSEAAFRHEIALSGLPLDSKELDKTHRPRARKLDQQMLTDLFAQAGASPVATQVDEVNRLKKDLDDAISAAEQGKDGQAALAAKGHALARILRGLVTTASEREQVRAALHYFKDDASLGQLKGRMQKALEAAKAPPKELSKIEPRKLPEAFLFALRTEDGQPASAFAADLAAQLPAAGPVPAFDKLFQAALEKQVASLDQKYNAFFAGALGTAPPEGVPAGRAPEELQKAAVARLLFGLAPYLAEQALSGEGALATDKEILGDSPPGSALFETRLPNTDTYERLLRRALVVTGPEALTGAVLERAASLREMRGDVEAEAGRERSQFVTDNAALVRQLRVLAELLRDESRRVAEAQRLGVGTASLVESQKESVKKRQEELRDSLRETNALYAELQAKSGALLKTRQAIQEAVRQTERGEAHIRYLEDLARGASTTAKK